MPKQKTRRATAKRFKVTKSGKIKMNHAFRRHILTKKTPKRKRGLRALALNRCLVAQIRYFFALFDFSIFLL